MSAYNKYDMIMEGSSAYVHKHVIATDFTQDHI